MAAARAWAWSRRSLINPEQASGIDGSVAKDFALLGVAVPPEAVSAEPETFNVWRSNWRTLTAFIGLETQWRVAATPAGLAWLGLDYAAAAAAFHSRRPGALRRLLTDLRVMEAEALPILNGEVSG